MAKSITAWGKECKSQMVKNDMSLNDVASATGYTRTYISSIINGRVIVPIETQIKIGNALGVDNKLIGN
jgi:plasmid maintenance system antidote protein VapI